MNFNFKSKLWRIGIIAGLIAIISASPVLAFPRVTEHRGTATTTSSNFSPSFNPSAWCFTNESATIDAYINFAGSSTASNANDTPNILIKANTSVCWRSNDQNVTNAFTMAVVSVSATLTYRMTFFRGR